MRVFRDDYPEIVDQLVDLFVDSTPPLLEELRDGAGRGDAEAVRRAAHKLKGSCQNIGASWLATLASEIEQGETPAAIGRRRARRGLRGHLRRAPGGADARRPVTFVLALLAVLAVVLALLVTGGLRRARASEARYRALASASPDVAVMLLDRDFKVVLFEGLALERQGWRAAEFLGRRLPDDDPARADGRARAPPGGGAARRARPPGLDQHPLGRHLPDRHAAVRRGRSRDAGDPRHHRGAGAAGQRRGAGQLPRRPCWRRRRGACRCATPTGGCCTSDRPHRGSRRRCTRWSGPSTSASSTQTGRRSGRTRRRCCARCGARP